ncbi:clathrin adaptor complex small chain-domain-containing protein [Chaetomium strumarium]|uniref:AP-1 complex subunit sigma-1 n=1 Tax=Chaetomium strumarium TaxID=1170767 RepID=A0AAJ0H0G7_9PEZI|nr:clathrin adaptor complex small chain-domain-containing protein [Chaetomium strumarium]
MARTGEGFEFQTRLRNQPSGTMTCAGVVDLSRLPALTHLIGICALIIHNTLGPCDSRSRIRAALLGTTGLTPLSCGPCGRSSNIVLLLLIESPLHSLLLRRAPRRRTTCIIMAINYLILLSRQGKVRLAKWFTTLSPKDKAKIVKDVSQLVLARRTRMCNFLEYKGECFPQDTKIVYRRYASLFFIAGCSSEDNELITLEIIHRYVEQMDKYYGNVCELDIIFSFTKAYYILDELLLAGELQESSKKNVLRCISQQDALEDMERRLPLGDARGTFMLILLTCCLSDQVEDEVTKIM